MTLNTITCNGVEKSLADWGMSRCVREVNNQGSDHVSFDMLAQSDVADPFPFGTQIILRIGRIPSAKNPVSPWKPPTSTLTPGLAYSGGTIFYVGWRLDCDRSATPEVESLRYKFGGPFDFFLDRLVFQKLFLTWNGTQQIADWRSQVVLGQSLTDLTGPSDTIPGSIATTRLSLSQQIREIVNYAINETTAEYGAAQFQFDPLTMVSGLFPLSASPGTFCKIPDYVPGGVGNGFALGQTTQALEAPIEAVQDITCGEALRRQLSWISGTGSPIAWFDYTQTPPALNIATLDKLTAVALPAFPANGETPQITLKRRDDLVPTAVCLKFRVQTTGGGVTTTQVYDDIACAAGCTNESTGVTDPSLLPYRNKVGARVQTIDFEGPQTTSQSAAIQCVALDLGNPTGDATALACWTALYPDFKPCSNLALISGTLAVTDPVSGSAVSLTGYSYILLSGGVADWMETGGSPGILAKVRIAAAFSCTSPEGLPVLRKPIVVDAIVTNLPGGTYTSGEVESVGEDIPWGLASYIYNIEKVAKQEGTFTLQENEITDACPMGNCLNLTGGAAEWATMNAPVQGVSYDLDHGTTQLQLGTSPHLGAADLVQSLRVNRPPRMLFLIGSNLLND
jgi:hypothetical protein